VKKKEGKIKRSSGAAPTEIASKSSAGNERPSFSTRDRPTVRSEAGISRKKGAFRYAPTHKPGQAYPPGIVWIASEVHGGPRKKDRGWKEKHVATKERLV